MVEIPVTSSEHSHVGSRTTKTSQKTFLGGGGLALGLWCAKNFRELFRGVYNQGQPL